MLFSSEVSQRVRGAGLLLMAVLLLAGCEALGLFGSWPEGQERTPYPPEAFNFLILGDWGREGVATQRRVARSMAREAARDSSRFVVTVGDNFYENGVTSVADPHWVRSFERVYDAAALRIPWYPTLGNHDYGGSIQAQIDYSALSTRWTMPASYYAVEQMVDDTTQALFVFLDTVPLAQREAEGHKQADIDEQLRWLDSTLAATTAPWRIVAGHHPLYSAGEKHGDNPVLLNDLQDILERHRVAAYFGGHTHSLQHLRPDDSPVDYFLSGAGSSVRAVAPTSDTWAAVAVPGYLAVSLTADRLAVQLVDHEGEVHHEAALLRPDLRAIPTQVDYATAPRR